MSLVKSLVVILILFFIIGCSSSNDIQKSENVTKIQNKTLTKNERIEILKKLTKVISTVEKYYYNEIDLKEITNIIIKELLAEYEKQLNKFVIKKIDRIIYENNKIKYTKENRIKFLLNLTRSINLIEKNTTTKNSLEEIVNIAIERLIFKLNLASKQSYLPKKLKQINDNIVGVGLILKRQNSRLVVVSSIKNSPADKAGIKAGDIVYEIDGIKTYNMKLEKAMNLIYDKDNTYIYFLIKRDNKYIDFNIKREKRVIIPTSSKVINDKYLFLKILKFTKEIDRRIKRIIQKNINKNNIKGIIIDLRDNEGGYLLEVIRIADLFINDGLIILQKGRDEEMTKHFYAKSNTTITGLPIVILTNVISASGSEILAGALQDHKKALIIGEKTAGRGSVEIMFELSQQENFYLFISKLYRSNGNPIDDRITPDIEIKVNNDGNVDTMLNKAIEVLDKGIKF